MSTKKNPCTLCGAPGLPGLIAGAGKCQYHWNVGVYGQAWADQCARSSQSAEDVSAFLRAEREAWEDRDPDI